MKDFSFFFLKNSMGAKMRRGFRNFCNNDSSTSTLNQQDVNAPFQQAPSPFSYKESDHSGIDAPPRKSVTLEEMILQLELEEAMARREKAVLKYKYKEGGAVEEEEEKIRPNKIHHRMSCVNNSDILRSARKALNQYPRFSLDGRDAMYRSSFSNNVGPSFDGLKLGRILHLPQSLGGESVVWCKPGVVPKLMGLDVMPVPISRLDNSHTKNNKNNQKKCNKEKLCNTIRNQNLRRRAQMNELERQQRRHLMESNTSTGNIRRSARRNGDSYGSSSSSSNYCKRNEYCVMNPIAMEPVLGLGGPISWPPPYNYT